MSDDIPFEIQKEIIKRLPVKSLIQFISVSKPWKSLICSPKFIADHRTQPHRQHHLLVKYNEHSGGNYISIDDADDDSLPQHKFRVTIPESVGLAESTTRIVGSSCGLFCFFSTAKNMAVLWNPSIRRSVDIVVVVPDVLENSPSKTVVGFGVCPRTLDPKLVKITCIRSPYEFEAAINSNPWQVEVFTLSSNAWRSLSINLPRNTIALTGNQVAIDGIIYWLAIDGILKDETLSLYRLVMSFDTTTEEFTELYLPDSLQHSVVSCISKLRESLVVIEDKSESGLGVWKMEHGGTKIFTKLFNICTPSETPYNVLGFRNNGQPILEFKCHFQQKGLYVYEPSSGCIKFSGIYGKIDRVSSYNETLLLLDQ